LQSCDIRALAIKAWNCWATNRECKVLKFVRTGPGAEQSPSILPWNSVEA
jgi:hypothetical protein